VAQLTGRSLEKSLVKARRSTSLKALLSRMPDAGEDSDFARPSAKARSVRIRRIISSREGS
jgi:hypothetical protein